MLIYYFSWCTALKLCIIWFKLLFEEHSAIFIHIALHPISYDIINENRLGGKIDVKLDIISPFMESEIGRTKIHNKDHRFFIFFGSNFITNKLLQICRNI